MKSKITRCLVIMMSLLTVFGSSVNAENSTDDEDLSYLFQGGVNKQNEYQIISENSSLALFGDLGNGSFKLKNKQSGSEWFSIPEDTAEDNVTTGTLRSDIKSQIVVNYVTKKEETSSADSKSVNSSSADKKVTKIDNGIEVVYKFSEINTEIPVRYYLKNESFYAQIPVQKIIEGKDIYLLSISILPFFGAGNNKEEGYMFVPDGCGAVINFNNGVQSSNVYDRLLYGNEAALAPNQSPKKNEALRLPVFGIVKNNDALMATITQGDTLASIIAYNGNSRCGYNCVSSKVNLRFMFSSVSYATDETNKYSVSRVTRNKITLKDYTVKYDLLSGNDATVYGMANRYRNYLGLDNSKYDKIDNPVFNVNFLGSVEKKAVFLGIPYRKQITLTGFSQAESIIDSVKKSGINSISVSYTGYFNSGLLNLKVPKNAKPLRNLGGTSGFNNFKKYLRDNNFKFYPVLEFQQFRKSGNGINKNKDSIKTAFDQVANQYHFLRSIGSIDPDADAVMLINPSKITTVFDRLYSNCKKFNASNLALSTLSSTLYSDFNSKSGMYRNETAEYYKKILKNLKKNSISLQLESANAYALTYADKITDVPLYSSNYDIFDYDVPFYESVVHGRIPITGNSVMQYEVPQMAILKMIEYGCELRYDAIYKNEFALADTVFDNIFSASSELWIDKAADVFKSYQPLLLKIYNQKIVSHSQIADKVGKTVYENGIQVFVNYNNYDVNVDGINIPATSFESR